MHKRTRRYVLGLLLALAAGPAGAVKVVECIDADGNSSFRDKCPPGMTMKGEKRLLGVGGTDQGPSIEEIAAARPITVYSVPDCDACDLECETDCLEVARFALPALEPGPTTVQIFNGYGGSNALDIEILGASDTGDTGPDSGDTATDSGDSGADSGDTADSSDSGGDSSSDSGDSGDSGGDTAPDTGDTGASGVAAAPVELAWIPAEVGELVTPPL